MAELVVDMGSVLAALLAQHHEHVLRIQDVVVKLHKGEVSLDGNALRPGCGSHRLVAGFSRWFVAVRCR